MTSVERSALVGRDLIDPHLVRHNPMSSPSLHTTEDKTTSFPDGQKVAEPTPPSGVSLRARDHRRQQVVPSALHAHLDEVDRDVGHCFDDLRDFFLAARRPGTPPETLVVDPAHLPQTVPAAHGAGPVDAVTVVRRRRDQQEVGVAQVLPGNFPLLESPEQGLSTPTVRDFIAVDDHVFHCRKGGGPPPAGSTP